jgi:glycine cleavage system aminomethyltransferase T
MVCPTRQQTRVAEWMERHVPKSGYVQFNDVTSMYTVLLIIGPKSRELLSQVIEDDIDLKMLPFTFQVNDLFNIYNTQNMYFLYIFNNFRL